MRKLVVVLVLLLGLAVVADRIAIGVAEDRVATALVERGGLAGAPAVDITGFPFLTQAVGGRYEEVRISLTAADLALPEGARADLTLRGVHVPLSDALSGSVQSVPVDRIDGTATLPYALLAAELGPGTTLAADGDGLRISRTVEVLGYRLPLTAVGQVVLEGGEIVVDVEEVSGAGVEIPDFLVSRVNDLLDLRYRVPELPFGLQLTGVAPGSEGMDVTIEARNAVLAG